MVKDLSYYMKINYPYELSKEDEEDGFFATHPDLPGCMSEGETADEAIENLDAARELWIETRLEGGHSIPEPAGNEFSGRVSLRMPTSLHGQMAKIARREGISLNSLLVHALASYCSAQAAAPTEEMAENIVLIKDMVASMAMSQARKPADDLSSAQWDTGTVDVSPLVSFRATPTGT
jgi:antitoxin HicB